MRIFLALDTHDLDLDLRKLKVGLLRAKNLEHKWVPEHQRHIPIYPLGEMGQGKFQFIDGLISTIARGHGAFDLRLEGVWAYPNQESGRLLWVGVQNSRALRDLQGHLSQELDQHYDEDHEQRPFRPHLPIVRLRNHRDVSDIISPYKNADFGKVAVRRLVIYEMTSGGAFPTYQKLRDYELSSFQEEAQHSY